MNDPPPSPPRPLHRAEPHPQLICNLFMTYDSIGAVPHLTAKCPGHVTDLPECLCLLIWKLYATLIPRFKVAFPKLSLTWQSVTPCSISNYSVSICCTVDFKPELIADDAVLTPVFCYGKVSSNSRLFSKYREEWYLRLHFKTEDGSSRKFQLQWFVN